MKFELPKLPYDFSSLEPYIDTKTMEIHYTLHHKTYLDKFNDIVSKKPELFNRPIIEIIKDINSLPDDIKTGVRNMGGGYFNHNIFFESLKRGVEMSDNIKRIIEESFVSIEKFKEEFNAKALGLFGSGWVWLVLDNSKLMILTTQNQDNPITNNDVKVLLGLDVWEHAYYLKYNNRRGEYINNWWNVINWDYVESKINE